MISFDEIAHKVNKRGYRSVKQFLRNNDGHDCMNAQSVIGKRALRLQKTVATMMRNAYTFGTVKTRYPHLDRIARALRRGGDN